jgi:hypothetical protein
MKVVTILIGGLMELKLQLQAKLVMKELRKRLMTFKTL